MSSQYIVTSNKNLPAFKSEVTTTNGNELTVKITPQDTSRGSHKLNEPKGPKEDIFTSSLFTAYLTISIVTIVIVISLARKHIPFYNKLNLGIPLNVLISGIIISNVLLAFTCYEVALKNDLVWGNLTFFLIELSLIMWAFTFFGGESSRKGIVLLMAIIILLIWLMWQLWKIDIVSLIFVILIFLWYSFVIWRIEVLPKIFQ